MTGTRLTWAGGGCALVVAAILGPAPPGALAWGQCYDERILAAAPDEGDRFAAALAAWGDVLVVGATHDEGGAAPGALDVGAAYVHRFDGSAWAGEQQLLASDGNTGDRFGYAVAIHDDVIVVTAHRHDALGADSGAAYVFRYAGGAWVEEQKLTAADGAAGDVFGSAVALRGDTLLIGARGDDDNGDDSGSAYVFGFDGIAWVQAQRLLPVGAAGWFGHSVAMMGEALAVGAPVGPSAVYLFGRDDEAWALEQTLNEPQPFSAMGFSLAADEEALVIGIRWGDGKQVDSGTACVVRRQGETWVLEQELVAADGQTSDRFGWSVDVSGDTILVGAIEGDHHAGSAYVFRRDGVTWTQALELSPGSFADNVGYSIALAGATAFVGALGDDQAGTDAGAAYVFSIDQDADQDGALDRCDNCPGVANAEQSDCDGDGVGDVCITEDTPCGEGSIPAGCVPALDCNGNGVRDACEIAAGASLDCNGNGLPDECEAGLTDHLYQVDDGTLESAVGGNFDGHIWLNRFTAQEHAEVLIAVEIAWGQIPSECVGCIGDACGSMLADVAVWSDPDGDGDPADALLLRLVPDVLAENVLTGLPSSVDVSPVFVGEAGASYFVGAHMHFETAPHDCLGVFPASWDSTPPSAMRSWHAVGDNVANLSDNPGPPVLIDSIGLPGNWLIRARTRAARDCDGDGVLDECRIVADPGLDGDGDGVLDACEQAGDLNGDGAVDVVDLLAVILSWGPCPSPPQPCTGDADGDGQTGVHDLLAVLLNWG